MFLIAMFIVYFDYISSIVSLLLCLCISSYSDHPNIQVPWVSGMHYVSVVLRYYISVDALCISSSRVVYGCDRPTESFVSKLYVIDAPYVWI